MKQELTMVARNNKIETIKPKHTAQFGIDMKKYSRPEQRLLLPKADLRTETRFCFVLFA